MRITMHMRVFQQPARVLMKGAFFSAVAVRLMGVTVQIAAEIIKADPFRQRVL
jgi:hypothetical protein